MSRRFIHTVTVTGADDSIKPESLLGIAAEFSFVEFGILLSERREGLTRFPSQDWLGALSDISGASRLKVRYSGHICGRWVRQILLGDWPPNCPMFFFKRFQLNTHALRHDFDTAGLLKIIRGKEDAEFILQYDKVNTNMIDVIRANGLPNVSTLFDLSHGAGVLPSEWPEPIRGFKCGYAGGLSPTNVAGQIEKISGRVPEGTTIWIDAESHLYDAAGRFSPDLVRAFLKAAEPYIIV